jgi:hypothetical protein
MTKMKKFRKTDWSDDEEVVESKRQPKKKKFDRALKTKDIEYLSNYYDEDEYDY